MIEEGAKRALQDLAAVKAYVPARPTTITIELESVDKAAGFRGRQGVEIVEPLKVVSRGDDWMQAWDQVWHW
jgi:D-aminopeptidase